MKAFKVAICGIFFLAGANLAIAQESGGAPSGEPSQGASQQVEAAAKQAQDALVQAKDEAEQAVTEVKQEVKKEAEIAKQEALVSKEETKLAKEEAKAPALKVDEAPKPQPSKNGFAISGDRFRFVSYGRIQVGIDPRDYSVDKDVSISSPAVRVNERTYSELGFSYKIYEDDTGLKASANASLAFLDGFGPITGLINYSGDFSSIMALRNLYAQIENFGTKGTRAWVGSKFFLSGIYYLLGMWPVQCIGIVGGGFGYTSPSNLSVDLNFGIKGKVDDIKDNTGKSVIPRQRFVSTLDVTQTWKIFNDMKLFARMYFELHHVASYSDTRTPSTPPTTPTTPGTAPTTNNKKIPSDFGWLIGGELQVSDFLRRSYVRGYVKLAGGLAAYDLNKGSNVNFNRVNDKTTKALNLFLGVDNVTEFEDWGFITGGWATYFQDANTEQDNPKTEGWGLGAAIRGIYLVGNYFRPGIELDHQLRIPKGPSDTKVGSIVKLSFIPALGVGRHIMNRPELRLIYTLSFMNQAAKDMYYAPGAEQRSVEQYIGVGFEWLMF